MLKLKRNRVYRVTDLYPESGYYNVRGDLIDCTIHVSLENFQPPMPRYNLSLPCTLRHARVCVDTGNMRGRVIMLTYFTAHVIDTREQCSCKAYPFPHTKGGGRCLDTGVEAYCGSCGYSCYPKWVDNGIGPTEFWGAKSWHHEWEWESDCCSSSVFANPEQTIDYEGEEDAP